VHSLECTFFIVRVKGSDFQKVLTVRQIVDQVEQMAPPALALPEDPTGLQAGSMDWEVRLLMLALDASLDTIQQAATSNAGMLLTHHPLIFKPLRRIDTQTAAGQAIACSLENRVAVYSAHTNLDAARDGINWTIADYLNLRNVQVLLETSPARVKLVTFVPRDSVEALRSALFTAGAGRIGAYTHCSFSSHGTGTFYGADGTKPAVGESGALERVPEERLEIVLEPELISAIVPVLRDHHPYEEPATDLYSLLPAQSGEGLGLAGELPGEPSVEEVARDLVARLDALTARLVGDKGARVKRLALCAGSGASLLKSAANSGADLFVTGDVKYHDAREAQETGMAVLDIGHFAPERYGLERFGMMLESKLKATGAEIQIIHAQEKDPFSDVTGS
jgi:dinuclear metal center YbgI/SA1388 family protein